MNDFLSLKRSLFKITLIKKLILLINFVLLIGILDFNSLVYAAGDVAAGKEYWAKKCNKCHGAPTPKESDAFADMGTTANKLSVYASDPAAITKSPNEGYIIPQGNTAEEILPGTNTNIPMKDWVGMGKDRLGVGKEPTTLAINISAYLASFFDPPAAPKINKVTPMDSSAMVDFTPPKSDLTITSYTVLSAPSGIMASGTTSPITITGLSNGTAYTFTVSATSNAGTGKASSASTSVTPSAAAPKS